MAKKHWRTNQTILLVGEGADEEAFLNHVKSNFVLRGSGKSVKVKNAQGKGATHVVEWTIRQMATAEYNTVAVMVDTDKDWTPAIQEKAANKNILLLPSTPCFEAVMLRVLDQHPNGNAQTLKKLFAPFVHNKATESESYQEHFSAGYLIANRLRDGSINRLLQILGV